jgi:hypothetical protein
MKTTGRIVKKSIQPCHIYNTKVFNPVEFVEGIRDRWRYDRFVIEDFATDGKNRIYRFYRIGKTLAFS